ncbi:MAG: hypothetical protein IT332_04550 [Ardenticatenales bacterium]|nr:hypothetical protein [Ardenticatenales bacterium]
MFVNSDFSDLLRCLADNGARYMVVGGYAVVQYAEPRYTKDLDLWISTDPENAAAVFRALKQFGVPLKGLTAADFAEDGYFYQMGSPPVRVDVMMGLPGMRFESAWPNRVVTVFGDLAVSFISKADLIESKRAAGRAQDILDADALSGVP